MIAFFIVMPIICVSLGFATCALLTIAKQSDRHAEQNPPKEKTKLLTVGSLVRWRGDVYEIRFFREDKDKQTLACIFKNANSAVGLTVPIEELEAMEE